MLSQLRLDVLRQTGPLVVHGDQHTGQNQGRIEAAADQVEGLQELDQTLERQVLGLHRDDHPIGPVQAEYLALEGLVQFLETLDVVRRSLNPSLVLTGVLITMYDERTRLAQDVEAELRQHLPEQVFDTVIPRSVRVAEAPSHGVPVLEHAPGSSGSTAYRALAAELERREPSTEERAAA